MGFDDFGLRHASQAVLWAWLLGIAVVGAWEAGFPLRSLQRSLSRRWISHLALLAIAALIARAIFPVLGLELAQRDGGLLRAAEVPWAAAIALYVAAQDLRGYLLHRLLHASPLLWRIHRVHHTDADLDLTTALRQHPFEALGATGLRLAVIAWLGPPVAAILLYELLDVVTALFAHANARLPRSLERAASWLLVTPDVHRIHHSVERADANSNFADVLSVWDRCFGTFRSQPGGDPARMRMGDPEWDDPDGDRLAVLLLQPFLPVASKLASPVPAAPLRS